MNIYKVSRTDEVGWDEYDSFVCVAETAAAAKKVHPFDEYNNTEWPPETYSDGYRRNHGWVKREAIETLQVEYVGTGDGPARIVLSSFCAG
jgi:hypothetical protein